MRCLVHHRRVRAKCGRALAGPGSWLARNVATPARMAHPLGTSLVRRFASMRAEDCRMGRSDLEGVPEELSFPLGRTWKDSGHGIWKFIWRGRVTESDAAS